MSSSFSESDVNACANLCFQSSRAWSMCRFMPCKESHVSNARFTAFFFTSGNRSNCVTTCRISARSASSSRSRSASAWRRIASSTSPNPDGSFASSSSSFDNVDATGWKSGSKSCGSARTWPRMPSTTCRILDAGSCLSCIFLTTRCRVPTSHLHRPSISANTPPESSDLTRSALTREESGRSLWAAPPISTIRSRTTLAFSSRSLLGTLSKSLLT
mmetsp:Transcript_127908/g.368482  ORF Transcript_127908/g.368482 Transcript_127908/m.368482 type:complete len:216 (+) Transcript_127908:638-1285(+)